jgi:hypothetical protein
MIFPNRFTTCTYLIMWRLCFSKWSKLRRHYYGNLCVQFRWHVPKIFYPQYESGSRSETSVAMYETTRRHKSEDRYLRNR